MDLIGPREVYKKWPRSPFFRPQRLSFFFFSDPGSSHESWNHLKFGGFDRSLTFFKWVWRKKFHVDFSSPMYGKQKWKKNPCRYQYIKRVRVHLKGGRNAFLRLVKNTQKTSNFLTMWQQKSLKWQQKPKKWVPMTSNGDKTHYNDV